MTHVRVSTGRWHTHSKKVTRLSSSAVRFLISSVPVTAPRPTSTVSNLTVTSYEFLPLRWTPTQVEPGWSGPRPSSGWAGANASGERSGSTHATSGMCVRAGVSLSVRVRACKESATGCYAISGCEDEMLTLRRPIEGAREARWRRLAGVGPALLSGRAAAAQQPGQHTRASRPATEGEQSQGGDGSLVGAARIRGIIPLA